MPQPSARTSGILYIVATPIGNLEDISARALTTLQKVDTILAEDTRHSRPLLIALNIKTPLSSLHKFNEQKKSDVIIQRLLAGESFALISDAGTPLISDPGFPLVKKARKQGITVTPIPGPSAIVTALSAAGIPCDSFTFLGFLPARKNARKEKLESFKHMQHTIVLYESTHRIIDTLEEICNIFGDNIEIVLAKELTKIHETFLIDTCSKIKDWLLQDKKHQKGEFVILIPPQVEESAKYEIDILAILLQELPSKQAVKLTNIITNTPKNELYKRAIQLKSKGTP